jgi:hypothetical protein
MDKQKNVNGFRKKQITIILTPVLYVSVCQIKKQTFLLLHTNYEKCMVFFTMIESLGLS